MFSEWNKKILEVPLGLSLPMFQPLSIHHMARTATSSADTADSCCYCNGCSLPTSDWL